jgi:DNA-binding transcriptional MerR regulator
VLRFWEGEFSIIQPKRTPSGQRLYRRQDVLTIFEIRHLLHQKKFTIEGARQHLKRLRRRGRGGVADSLEEIRAGLQEIRDLLS